MIKPRPSLNKSIVNDNDIFGSHLQVTQFYGVGSRDFEQRKMRSVQRSCRCCDLTNSLFQTKKLTDDLAEQATANTIYSWHTTFYGRFHHNTFVAANSQYVTIYRQRYISHGFLSRCAIPASTRLFHTYKCLYPSSSSRRARFGFYKLFMLYRSLQNHQQPFGSREEIPRCDESAVVLGQSEDNQAEAKQ